MLITSPSGAARVERARAWLAERPCSEPLLVLAAAPDAGRELLRAALPREPGAAFGWRATTLPRLCGELAGTRLAAAQQSPISLLAVEALAARVVQACGAAAELGRFAAVAQMPGFVRALAATLTELRLAGVERDALLARDRELGVLLDAFVAELGAAGLADWPAVLREATAALRAQSSFEQGPVLLLDLPVRWRAEADFVAALVERAPDVLATVPSGDERTLRFVAPLLGAPEEAVASAAGSALADLQRHLFSASGPEPAREPDGTVAILSAPGESRECVEIARGILACAEEGVPFDEMAILLRAPEEYRPHVEEALSRARVPAHFERGTVRPDPAGRAFLALLRCALDGLSARCFAEYLSLAQVPDADAEGKPPAARPSGERWVAPDHELVPEVVASAIEAREHPAAEESAETGTADPEEAPVVAGGLRAPRRWERLIVDASVIGGGVERWRRRLGGLARELELSLAEASEVEQDRLARDRDALRALGTFALPLLDELAALPPSAVWGEWLDQLAALATRALRRPERVLAVLSELAPMASVGPVDLREVARVLERRLLEVHVPPDGNRQGKVLCAPIDAARGRSFEVVFVPGLAEKLFPRRIAEDPILLDRVRGELGDGLPDNADRLGDERLALRIAAGAAGRRAVLSFPRLDLELARPRVPSFYALESLRAAEGRLPLFDELAQRAERVADARIGWPAPRERTRAIDDAEYDLAVLESLLRLDPDETLGAARYLLTANAHLARALRFRASRWLKARNWADGLWQPSDEARAALVPHQLDARSYSPTALEKLAACPYRFFLYAVHRLSPREVPVAIEDMDPLQRGSLVHDVQFELFRELERDGLLPVGPARLSAAQERLDQVLARVAERYRDELAPAIPRVWDDGVAAVRADLREWLRLASEDRSGFEPWRFELAFGLAEQRGRDERSVADAVALECGIRLRGSIDLVERRPADGAIRVTDHKTGKAVVEQGACIGGGKALQPVLYALAAEGLFPDAEVVSGRLSYCTTRGGFEEREVPLDEASRKAAAELAAVVQKALEDGAFPAAPEERACEWCDYRPVCGPYEELRERRKRGEPVPGLTALRRRP